jgi:hypothetical protein
MSSRGGRHALTVILAAMLVLAREGWADIIGSVCEGGKNVEVIEGPEGCVGFITRRAGRIVSRAAGFLGSGSVISSADGRSVVFVHHYPQTRLREDGSFDLTHIPEADRHRGLEALVFFRDGQRTRAYTLEALLHQPRLIDQSSSHVAWLLDQARLDRDEFAIVATSWSPRGRRLGTTLTIITTSLREYRFDTVTGEMIAGGDHSLWTRCDVIAFGLVNAVSEGRYAMDQAVPVKGSAPREFTFTAASKVKITPGPHSVCLRQNAEALVADRTIPVRYNAIGP